MMQGVSKLPLEIPIRCIDIGHTAHNYIYNVRGFIRSIKYCGSPSPSIKISESAAVFDLLFH